MIEKTTLYSKIGLYSSNIKHRNAATGGAIHLPRYRNNIIKNKTIKSPAKIIPLTICFVQILVFFQSGSVGGCGNYRQVELGVGRHASMVAVRKRNIVSNAILKFIRKQTYRP